MTAQQNNRAARQAAEAQQAKDAKDLLDVALTELAEDQKAYTRIENNVRIFVDRTNHEMAALALVIQQKIQNVETLKKIVAGYFVMPEPAAVSKESLQKAVEAEAPEKTNGKAVETPAEPQSTAEVAP